MKKVIYLLLIFPLFANGQSKVHNHVNDKGSKVVSELLLAMTSDKKDENMKALIAPSFVNKFTDPNLKINCWGSNNEYYITKKINTNTYLVFYPSKSRRLYFGYEIKTTIENGQTYILPPNHYLGEKFFNVFNFKYVEKMTDEEFITHRKNNNINEHLAVRPKSDYTVDGRKIYKRNVTKNKKKTVIAKRPVKTSSIKTNQKPYYSDPTGWMTADQKKRFNKAWDSYNKSRKAGKGICPVCAGSGKKYISKNYKDKNTKYSEDDTKYYKKTTTKNKTKYQRIKCNRCKGSGKIK